jgi:hypothetical protein
MKMKFIKISLTVFFLIASISATYAGGDRTNLQGVGMARTFTAVARGIDAVGVNPANLGYLDRGTVTFNILNFGIHGGSDFWNQELYTKYFTGDENGNAVFLDDAAKEKIIGAFPSGIALTSFDFEIKSFAISYQYPKIGGFVFSVTDRAGFNMNVPKDYVQFALYGNPINTKYDLSDTYFGAMWLREYALSYGRRTPRFVFMKSMTAGITLKLIQGYGYAELVHNKTLFSTNENAEIFGKVDYRLKAAGVDFMFSDSSTKFQPFPKPAGVGYGFDIGVSGFIRSELSVGIALVNIGTVKWSQNTREISGHAELNIDDPFAGNQLDTLDKALKGEDKNIGSFSTGLPAALRLGAVYQLDKAPWVDNSFPGELLLAFDYNQGFNNLPGNTTNPRFSLGAEYKPWKWLPIRTGLSVGGTDHVNMGFGFGFLLGFFDWEFATENLGAVFTPKDFRRISFATGMRIRI